MASSNTPLANRILIGLVIGAVAGVVTLAINGIIPSFAFPWQDAPRSLVEHARAVSAALLDPFGQVFLRMLFFVVIPLVFASLASGVVQLGALNKLGPLAGRTFALFFANMAIACALGIIMMKVVNPGGQLDADTQARLMSEYGGAAQSAIERRESMPAMSFTTVVEMFMPRNVFGAFVGNNRNLLGDVLPLIIFALLVGAAGTQLGADSRAKLQTGLDLVAEVMTKIVNFALQLAPYAVPAMIYSVIVKIGVEILMALGVFVLGCLFVLALHLFGVMSIWLRVLGRMSPVQFFKDIRPVLITAFSTSSSSATMPTSLACAKETLKCSPSTTGFVIPLGATMNMSGTALFEGCVVLFIAQVFGVDLSLGQQITLVLLSVLSAVAVAGIPGGSLPLIAGLLITFGIPAEGIGIILGVDRILDMARTTVNVGCDMVTVAVVDRQVNKGGAAAS